MQSSSKSGRAFEHLSSLAASYRDGDGEAVPSVPEATSGELGDGIETAVVDMDASVLTAPLHAPGDTGTGAQAACRTAL